MYVHGHAQAELIDFQITFLMIAFVSLFALIDAFLLAKDAGDSVSGYQHRLN